MKKQKILMDKKSQEIFEKGDITKETKLLMKYGELISSDVVKVIAQVEDVNSEHASYIDVYRLSDDNSELIFICRRTENYYT